MCVPFDSKHKPQQLIQTRLNSFGSLTVYQFLFKREHLNLMKRLYNAAKALMASLVSPRRLNRLSWWLKCAHTLEHNAHGDTELVPTSLHPAHRQRDLFASANAGHSSVLFSRSDSGQTCHILSRFWKIHSLDCRGPGGAVNLSHNSLVSISPSVDFTFPRVTVEVEELYICVCALSGFSFGRCSAWTDVRSAWV